MEVKEHPGIGFKFVQKVISDIVREVHACDSYSCTVTFSFKQCTGLVGPCGFRRSFELVQFSSVDADEHALGLLGRGKCTQAFTRRNVKDGYLFSPPGELHKQSDVAAIQGYLEY